MGRWRNKPDTCELGNLSLIFTSSCADVLCFWFLMLLQKVKLSLAFYTCPSSRTFVVEFCFSLLNGHLMDLQGEWKTLYSISWCSALRYVWLKRYLQTVSHLCHWQIQTWVLKSISDLSVRCLEIFRYNGDSSSVISCGDLPCPTVPLWWVNSQMCSFFLSLSPVLSYIFIPTHIIKISSCNIASFQEAHLTEADFRGVFLGSK